MFKLIISNLRQRPTRTLVSIIAVALGVSLILVSVGLSYGVLDDSAERTRRIGGDFMFQPPDASLFTALNAGTLPEKLGPVIAGVDGVGAVTPILSKFISDGFHLIYGIDKASFMQVNRSLHFVKGRMFDSPYEAIADTIFVGTRHLKVGDPIEILGHQFVISGVFEEGTASRVMVPLPTLQEMNGTPDKVTMFFIRVRKGAGVDAVYTRLKDRFSGYKIIKTADLQQLMTSNTPVFKQFVAAIVIISAVISFLIILLAMYSTITERTREIGILKSLGASRSFIVQLILKESLLICLLGVGMGFILTSVAIKLILAAFPTLHVNITSWWRLIAVSMAVLGGVTGALYPAVKAAHLDPVRALGYE